MNIIQELLSSTSQVKGGSQRFQFAAGTGQSIRSRFRSGGSFSDELYRQINSTDSGSGFDEIKFNTNEGGSVESDRNLFDKLDSRAPDGFGSESTTNGSSFSADSRSSERTRAIDDSTETSFGEANPNRNNLNDRQKKTLRELEQGKIDLSESEDRKKIKDLVTSLADESQPGDTQDALYALEKVVESSKDFGSKLEDLDKKQLKKFLEDLTKLLETFKQLLSESRNEISNAVAEKIQSIVDELGLDSDQSSKDTIDVKQLLTESNSGQSDGGSLTKNVKQSISSLIETLRSASSKLAQSGNSEKSASLLESLKKQISRGFKSLRDQLTGSGKNGSDQQKGSSKIVNNQLNSILDQLNQQVKDEDLGNDIRKKLKQLRSKTKNADSSKQQTAAKEGNQSSDSTSSKQSNSKGKSMSEAAKAVKDTSKTKSGEAKSKNGKQAATSSKGSSKKHQPAAKVAKSPDDGKKQPDKATQQFKNTEQAKQSQSTARNGSGDGIKKESSKNNNNKANGSGRTGKLASFENNSARSVQASEESGTSFSNQGNTNQNSRNTATGVRSQSASGRRSPSEARRMINQIVERAQTMVEDGKQSMKMQLQPESLGQIKLEVSVEANQVSARFKVENRSVKQTLRGNMEQLKQSLDQIGMEIDNVDVSDMASEDGENAEQWFDEPDQAGPGDLRGQGAEEDNVEAEETVPGTRTRPLREYSTIELVA